MGDSLKVDILNHCPTHTKSHSSSHTHTRSHSAGTIPVTSFSSMANSRILNGTSKVSSSHTARIGDVNAILQIQTGECNVSTTNSVSKSLDEGNTEPSRKLKIIPLSGLTTSHTSLSSLATSHSEEHDTDRLGSDYASTLAYRPFMSFSRLVSSHTLGDADDTNSISSEPEVPTFLSHTKSLDKVNRKITMQTSLSCNNSPRAIGDESNNTTEQKLVNSLRRSPRKTPESDVVQHRVDPSLIHSSSLTNSHTTTKSNTLDNSDKKTRSYKRSRLRSKEIDHWLEYQKKYGCLRSKSQVDIGGLTDTTNNLRPGNLSEPSSVHTTPRSDSTHQSNLYNSHMVQNGDTGSAATYVTHWSCNMNAAIKRKQELEEEIKTIVNSDTSLAENFSDRHFDFASRDESEVDHKLRSRDLMSEQSSSNDSQLHLDNLKAKLVPEAASLSRSKKSRAINEPISGLLETLSHDTLPVLKTKNVIGKPPVPPKRSYVMSLREVPTSHFSEQSAKGTTTNRTVNEHILHSIKKRVHSISAGDSALSRSWDGQCTTEDSETSGEPGDAGLKDHVFHSVQSDTRKKNGRRSVSDLGFSNGETSKTSRTAALLRNPAMRKNLARSMGLSRDASEEDIQEILNERLDSIMSGSNKLGSRSSSSISLCSYSAKKLNDLHRASSLSDGINEPISEPNRAREYAFAEASEPPLSKSDSKLRNIPVENESQNLKVASKFQIPSFREYKKKHKLEKRRPISGSFESYIEEPIKEEPELQSENEGQRSRSLSLSRIRDGRDIQNNNSSKCFDSNKFGSKFSASKISSNCENSQNSSQELSEKYCDCINSNNAESRSFSDSHTEDSCSKCGKIGRAHMRGLGTLPFDSQLQSRGHFEPRTEVLESSQQELSAADKLTKHNKKWRKKIVLDSEGSVNRSVSDVSDICAEEERKKSTREKRQKIYKSDPLGKVKVKSQHTSKATSEGAEIENELLSLIQDVQSSSAHSLESTATHSSVQSVDSCLGETSSEEPPKPPPRKKKARSRKKKKKRKDQSGRCEIERTDSGVGRETLHSANSTERDLVCAHCDEALSVTDALDSLEKLCQDCVDQREERKRAIREVVDTEESYGKDLKIMFEEFYVPMKCNGLLNQDQLDTIFLNLEELMSINAHFLAQLRTVVNTAFDNGDKDLSSVAIGELFLETTNMLLAFETYCIDQSDATMLLEQLEKERELLKIFLEVSQAENSTLRRMHLKAFLVVPVQRIMKYPLLLNRIYQKTPEKSDDKFKIKEAKRTIEEILEHINFKTKGTTSMRVKKKFFMQQLLRRSSDGIHEDLETHKIAIESLGWSKNEVSIVYSGKLLYTTMPDLNSTKRGKFVKYIPVHGVLITLGKGSVWDSETSSQMWFGRQSAVQQCALVLLKEKQGRYTTQREPFFLEKCVVSMDSDLPEMFELHDMSASQDCYLFKSEDHKETTIWFNHIKFQGKDLGKWRHRRNALPNIMIALGKNTGGVKLA